MNNIYSLHASQEAQPLQKKIWITYHFVQIHKLNKAASPTTYKKNPVAWRVVDSWIDTFMVVFSFRAQVGLSDGVNKIMLFTGRTEGGEKFMWVCVLGASPCAITRVSGAFRTGLLESLCASLIWVFHFSWYHLMISLAVTVKLSLERLQCQSDDPRHAAVEWLILQAHETVEGQRSSSNYSSDPSLVKSSIVLGAQIN